MSCLKSLKSVGIEERYLTDSGVNAISHLTRLTFIGLSCIYSLGADRKLQIWVNNIARRNNEISWKVVHQKFLDYCIAIASLDLPVLIQIHIFNYLSYDNHRYKKWEIAKSVKDKWIKRCGII